VEVVPIEKDGSLKSPSAFVQHRKENGREPRGHYVEIDASNKFALVADLGLDKIMVYKFDAGKGLLTPNDVPFADLPSKSGPRHFAFTPNGKRIYVIGESDLTVTGFDYDSKKGVLTKIETVSTLPAGATGKNFSTAEIFVHPNGKYVYGSNRGHDTIAVFAIDQKTGKLSLIQNEPTGGKIPRNFNIDPSGKFLYAANQDSDNIVAFKIDPATGKLTPTGETYEVGRPVSIVFLPL
jgi:6-phosphogluconolactonase